MIHTILLALAMGADLQSDYANRVRVLRGSWRMETTLTGPGKTIRQTQTCRFWDEGGQVKLELKQTRDGVPMETVTKSGSYEELKDWTKLHFVIDVPEDGKALFDPVDGLLSGWERHWKYEGGQDENTATMRVLEWTACGGIPYAKRAAVDWQLGKDVTRHDELTFDLYAPVPWTLYLWIASVALLGLGIAAYYFTTRRTK